ncbi:MULTISPECIES: hypothetical protein [Streptomyces]|uniref:Uncharacterized protein n=1 Tax=Streptomyces decoyicus TaxID=249567 RepID=A0ABZ1FB42_9ACTN|nr:MULTISPECIES: hypothetical protein [Streptomyces]MCL7493664.1 hypothetical protein [Streptomyces sp. MCA2]WSB67567.1 hypothetical protein OG863_06075 [Streptomyces decoyicus]
METADAQALSGAVYARLLPAAEKLEVWEARSLLQEDLKPLPLKVNPTSLSIPMRLSSGTSFHVPAPLPVCAGLSSQSKPGQSAT